MKLPQLLWQLAALLIGMALSSSTTASPAGSRPNVLLILADDLGYEMVGAYGGVDSHTPVVDALAQQGTLFERAYTSAVCTPSRMSLYTGTYVPRHRYTDVLPVHLGTRDAVDFDHRFPTYAQALRSAGYATAVTGKWQLAALEYHPEHCRSAGFDSWCVWQIWRNGHKTTRYWDPTINRDGRVIEGVQDRFGPDLLTGYVIDKMREAKESGQPFLIHHNMMLPHSPVTETPEDRRLGREPSLPHMIAYMDAQVGILLRALDDLGLADNTIVIFLGDNGTEASEPRPTRDGLVTGGKWKLDDGGTHVPLIIRWPGHVPAGRRVSGLVVNEDFFPTLCELAGAELPAEAQIDGVSFADMLLGRGPGKREWATAAFKSDFFVFDGQWRLHHVGERLVDCRDLPREADADMNTAEAQAAKQRLLPALRHLESLQAQK